MQREEMPYSDGQAEAGVCCRAPTEHSTELSPRGALTVHCLHLLQQHLQPWMPLLLLPHTTRQKALLRMAMHLLLAF